MIKREINGYIIETIGGFITIKYWIVYQDEEFIGTYFTFKEAKTACLTKDFGKAFKHSVY